RPDSAPGPPPRTGRPDEPSPRARRPDGPPPRHGPLPPPPGSVPPRGPDQPPDPRRAPQPRSAPQPRGAPQPRSSSPATPPSGRRAAHRAPSPAHERPADAPRRAPAATPGGPRRALRNAKFVLALVSALVLGVTGYGWATFQSLQEGLTTADVTGGFNAPDGATDILLVGNDSRTDAQGNPLPPDLLAQLRAADNEGELTDTVILVRIPNDGRRAVAISLPRDLYVEMPDGYGQHKLNSAYGRAKGEKEAELIELGADPATVRAESIAAGRRFLVNTVERLTGAGVDHYAEVNLLGFARLTEAVGGVQVCLKAPVEDDFSGADFPAGPQTIAGSDALAFVRQRHGLPRGDLDRVVRQQVFLAGLADRILSAGTLSNPGRIQELIGATQQALVLDENLDVLDFAARMQGVAGGDVTFVTVPVVGDAESDEGDAVLEVDPEAVQLFVAGVIDHKPAPGHAAAPQGASAITVDVLNASGLNGLAGRVSEQLTAQGFGAGMVGNADPRAGTVIRHASGEADRGGTVADALGGVPVEEDPDLAPGTVQVYLGEDYTGPGTQSLAGDPLLRLDGSAAAATPLRAAQPPPPASPIRAGEVPCVD
ncbi:MAG: LCP family protein, partial [Pseudonocardiaceae bacterium]